MAAPKTPFDVIPKIQDEEPAALEVAGEARTIAGEEFSKGNAPRNIIKSVQKIFIPVMALSIVAWLMWPEGEKVRPAVSPVEVKVDQTVQDADVGSIVGKLKDAARQEPAAQTQQEPKQQQKKSVSSSQERELTPKEREEIARLAAEKMQRDEEIRASALTASGGSFKLITDTQAVNTAGGRITKTGGNKMIDDLQSQISDFNNNRANAEKNQVAAQEKMLAALAPREPGRPKSANEDFLSQQSQATVSKPLMLQGPMGQYIVNEGTPVRTVLTRGVNSDLPGKITALVTSDVYDSNQQCVVIPKGSQLVGAYSNAIIVGQGRILMAMNRLILNNGNWISLAGAQANDMIGQAGMAAEVDNHFWQMFSTSLVIGGASLLLPKDQNTISTVSTAGGTQNGGSVLATTLNDILKQTLERNRVITPTLTLKPGEQFMFTVAQDMNMTCYR